jgi:hypothetical protein
VFEDDAVLRHDIKTGLPALLIDNWDIIVLGYNSDTPLELNIAPGISCGVRFCFGSRLFPARKPAPQQLFDFSGSTSSPVALHRRYLSLGTCGYVVSPKGAQVLRKSCFPLDNRPVHYDSVQHSFRAAALDAVMATVYRRIAAC